MEVDGLGARCALPSCRTLDYLPFTCATCALQFCNDHRTPASHACKAPKQRVVPTCPLCASPVPVPPGSAPDVAVSRHIDAGCPKRKRQNPVCAAQECTVRDHAATVCPSCRKVFCLTHRIEATHQCTALVSPSSAPKSTKQTHQKHRKPSKRAARRLDFVNTSADPIGDPKIELEDRVTVAVFFPVGSAVQPRFMYFSRKNSAGRIIDGLRKSVPQLPPPADGERYYLYAVKAGGYGVNLLPYITPLRELTSVLKTGDMLVLETGDQGLDPSWSAALRTLTPSSHHSRIFGKKKLPSFGRSSSAKSKSDACLVA